jgi:plastocyanin
MTTLLHRLSCGLVLLAPAPLLAAALTVHVADRHGAPVADAVIALTAPEARRAAPATHIIDQKDETFVPYVEVFHPGDKVVFRNSDTTRHHVYSFSPVKSFEFVLVPGEMSTPLLLDKTGTVAVGCNIHDHMITYLYVADAPWLARTDAGGDAQFAELPAGRYAVALWHPQLRGDAPPQSVQVESAPARVDFAIALLPDPRRQDPERAHY